MDLCFSFWLWVGKNQGHLQWKDYHTLRMGFWSGVPNYNYNISGPNQAIIKNEVPLDSEYRCLSRFAFFLVFMEILRFKGYIKKISWNLVFSSNFASVCMTDILEWVLWNPNGHTEIYQNRLCISQDHYLTSQNVFFSLDVYVPCVLADNNAKYSDRFFRKTTRARWLKIWPVTHNS